MKQSKRLLPALLILACVITLLAPLNAAAAEREYLVRFYPGNIGSISAGNATFRGTGNAVLPTVTVNADKDDIYFLKGFKESGKDTLLSPEGSVPATRDVDYVAVYGIRGNEVRYTVQYLLNGTTTKLHEDNVYYAGVGDKPVSSYIYIDGYQPYRRTTKTLEADESQNVLYCYYTAIAAAAGTATTTTTTVAGGGGGGVAIAGGAANAANPAGAAGNANAANPANPAGAANAANPATPAGAGNAANPAGAATPAPQENAAPAAPQYQQTEDILDLDVPLAAPDFGGGVGQSAIVNAPTLIEPTQRSPLPNWVLIAGVAVLVGLIAMLYWYLLFYRKKKRYEEYDFSAFDE